MFAFTLICLILQLASAIFTINSSEFSKADKIAGGIGGLFLSIPYIYLLVIL